MSVNIPNKLKYLKVLSRKENYKINIRLWQKFIYGNQFFNHNKNRRLQKIQFRRSFRPEHRIFNNTRLFGKKTDLYWRLGGC